MTRARLEAWAKGESLLISDEAWERLDRLVALWREYGRAINLVGGIEEERLIEHVQEGLQCVALVERTAPAAAVRWVDVGSGGGLPGLVVAAVRGWEMILVEPRERRAAFLELALAMIGAGSGRVIRARWEHSTWNEEGVIGELLLDRTPFIVLSSRAVFAASEWLREARNVAIPRGIIVSHVGISASDVAGEKPSRVVRGARWAVMAFPTFQG